ncbi:hypothetical protein KSS87_003867 [Heliosperma pusillum]|nr:hypothetical protein KSS87_003867 [Heliosperma pusillum]
MCMCSMYCCFFTHCRPTHLLRLMPINISSIGMIYLYYLDPIELLVMEESIMKRVLL